MKLCFKVYFSFFFLSPLLLLAQETEVFEEVKKDILCKTISFCLNENTPPQELSQIKLNCSHIDSLEASIPKDYISTNRIMRSFKNKKYESYGKNRVKARLDKLIQDISTELRKMRRDRTWKETIRVFVIELQNTRDEGLAKFDKKNQTKDTASSAENNLQKSESEPNTTTLNNKSFQNTQSNSMLVYFFIIALIGGIAFLYYQNKELQKQLTSLQEELTEKYSRLDNRLDTFTPMREYQALVQKFNFLNEQINAIIQEIMVLKSRNQFKVSPEEVYAKRTEHLEKQRVHPDLKIFYATYSLQLKGFDEQSFKTEPNKEHIFKIEIDMANPHKASVRVTNRSEYHTLAIQTWEDVLVDICEFDYPPHNDTKIITFEAGELQKMENYWKVIKKIKVSFE